MKTYWYFIISFFILVSQGATAYSQNLYSPYPIIFVHGLNSFEGTWDPTINFLKPYGDKQIFHAVLNAYSGLRRLEGIDGILGTNDDDVLFPTMDINGNAINQLHSGNLFVINFKNFWNMDSVNPKIITYNEGIPSENESKSNESAIYKQGYALSVCINAVRKVTGADKVILVGHSMGGLAIREYLQRIENKQRKWWVDPSDALNGHHIAKVVTIGTPHLGCNYALLDHSEAGRDLVYSYATSAPCPYLFSNDENNIPGIYPNYDINCNGNQTDWIDGINYNTSFSLVMPLPTNISYTWITSKWGQLNEDGIVDVKRQYLYEANGGVTPLGVSDTLLTNKFHTDEPADYYSIIRGLDEPDNISLAYEIGSNSITKGFITYQTNNNAVDKDVYKIILSQSGFLKLNIAGYFEAGVDGIELLDSDENSLSKLEYPDFYMGISKYITSGTYYVRVSGTAKSNSHMNPYTIKTDFYESESSTEGIVNLEYFLDSDPSWGKGIVLNTSSSSNITENINIPLNNVSDGFHTLFVRVKDVINRWSIPQNVPFYRLKVITPNLSQLEYFLDTDPGFGNGNQLSVTASSDMTKNCNIPLSGIQNGFHVLYVRAKDNKGNWSICNNRAFYKTEISSTDITNIEYFLDTDPGFGNAIPIAVTKGADVSKSIRMDLSNVSNGFHTLFIRTKDVTGKWSITSSNAFYRTQSQLKDITELEYFFDFDPEFGSGTVIPIIPAASDITKQFNVDLSCLTSGSHTFYVRAKDDLGNWSLIYSKDIEVSFVAPIITQNANILNSNALTGNQWYNQNGLIVGATNQNYVITANGDYYVIVTHSGCSSDKSNTIKVLVSGFEQAEISNSIKIYPNPTSESFQISGLNCIATLKLTDISGKEMLTKQILNNETVSISSLPKGLYIVKLITINGTVENKLLKK